MINPAFEKLQNGFYNAFSQGLGFPVGSPLQLLQPSIALTDDTKADTALWAYLDNIPPLSLTQRFIASGGNRFFPNYKGMLSALEGVKGTFKEDIGEEAYDAWLKYLPTVKPTPAVHQYPEVFFNWAMLHYPDKASVGAAALAQMILHPVTSAQLAVLAYPNGKPADWTHGFKELKAQVAQAPSLKFVVHSATMNSDVSKSWTAGVNIDFSGLLFGGSIGDSESATFASSSVKVEASFEHVTTFQAAPGPWYLSSAMALAFNNKQGAPWKAGAPINWENTFGAKGSMQRFAVNLIVADGMTVKVTGSAKFTTTQQNKIKQAQGGLWPFFFQGADTANNPEFNDDGQISISSTSKSGFPIILGVSVLPVNKFVGHAATVSTLLSKLSELAKAA